MIAKYKSKEFECLNSSEQYLTFDLGLATSLVCLNYELWSLEKSNPKKVQFIFKRDQDNNIDSAIEKYWKDKLKLNARTLFDNQKMLKNRIYSD